MKRFNEKGFTLIELLIVVAILGVLAAVAVPNVTKFIGRGEVEAQHAELATVQSALQTMMIDTATRTLDVAYDSANATYDMAIFPDAAHKLYPSYMQSPRSKYSYWADTNGTVAQNATRLAP